tara:strand:- start:17635 stop:18702 length:1068 start_codon:yes stop_codon:yes gene_type:complete
MSKFKIGNKYVGKDCSPYFIADIAANHDGDINRAFNLIELAKESGADAAKFQNFKANKIVSKSGFDNIGGKISHQSKWKKSVFEVYEEASISYEWTEKLKNKCNEVNIEYFTSPYDFDSVDKVDRYVNVYKIGSGDITWHEIIEYISSKKKPVIIATGASTLEEVKMAMDIITKNTSDVVLMQCNTNYTANYKNFNHINLNVIKTYSKIYPNVVLGLSDHTFGHATVLGAIAIGATVFEKHFTDDNERDGPDHKFSMNPNTWKDMIERSKELYLSLGSYEKKIEDNELQSSLVQRRILRFTKDLSKNHVIQKEDVYPLRPMANDGIEPYDIEKIIGKKIKNEVKKDDYIRWKDLI